MRAGLFAAAFSAVAIVARADEFNEARLRSGQVDFQAKRYVEAAEQFRVAAFGYLDQPVVLSECLVRLSLAQSAAGKTADLDATLRRFLDVERRFAAYAKANLDAETRSAFRKLLTQRIPAQTLAGIPSLSGRADGSAAAANPAAGSVPTAPSKDALAESRSLIAAGRSAEAEKVLTDALRTDPGNRSLHLSLLEAACLARAYDRAAAELAAVAPLSDSETTSMFYAALVLYETGKKEDARGYMKRALPNVSGPLVDEYSKKILDQP